MATCLEREDAVHLWTSDSDGGIHVLFNVRNSKGDVSMRWREGDGAKKSVVCGKGVVWSIDSGRGYLSLRTGVGWESPLGKKWSTTEQSATRIAVGGEYLALLNEDATSVLACSVPSSTAIMRDSLRLNFTSLPSPPKNFNHLLMDDIHTLYGITTNGEVYMYKGAESCNHGIKEWAESGRWVFLCKPPPIARRGGFLSSLFFSERSLFIDATLTNGQIFLLRTDPQEVWQLVITEVTFGDESQLKTAWNCFKFKDKSLQLSLITSNPLNNKELFAVTGDGNTLVCLHLEGQFVTHSELPFHACGDIKITSLSACHQVVATPPAMPTPGVYPKLPKLDTSESTLVINVGDPNWDTEYRDQLAANVSRWRKGDEYHLPRLVQPPSGRGLKRSRGSEETLTPPSKRSPFVWSKGIYNCHRILAGIYCLYL